MKFNEKETLCVYCFAPQKIPQTSLICWNCKRSLLTGEKWKPIIINPGTS